MSRFSRSRAGVMVVLVAIATLGVGCGARFTGTAMGRIPHPAKSFVSEATRLEIRDARAEQSYGFGPGTLADAAALVRVGPRAVCARLDLWAVEGDFHRGDFERYQFSLRARTATGDPSRDTVVAATRIEPLGYADRLETGTEWTQVPNGIRDQCRRRNAYGDCEQWDTQITTRAEQRSTVAEVRSYAANVCFEAPTAFVAMDTRELELVVHYRRRQKSFTWALDPSLEAVPTPTAIATPPTAPDPTEPPFMGTAPGVVEDTPDEPHVEPEDRFQLLSHSGDAVGAPSLYPDRIQALLRANQGRIEACWQGALDRGSSTRGRAVLQFAVEPSGRVSNVHLAEAEGVDAWLVACVTRVASELRWASGPDHPLAVSWPLRFSGERALSGD